MVDPEQATGSAPAIAVWIVGISIRFQPSRACSSVDMWLKGGSNRNGEWALGFRYWAM